MQRLYLLWFVFIGFASQAQDRAIVNEATIWYVYQQKVTLNNNWSLSGTFQFRDFLDRDEDYHLFLSTGLTRKLKHGFSVGSGFTNLNINQIVDGKYVLVPELRPYQTLSYGLSQGKIRFNWRLMAEERWFRKAASGELVSGYDYWWRFRNKFLFMFPIVDKVSLEVSSEVMANAGNSILINIFDQHRGIVQFHWDLAPFKINVGYMHWFVQTGANQHQNRHTILFGLSHQLNLAK